MTPTNLLEKIKRDHDEAKQWFVCQAWHMNGGSSVEKVFWASKSKAALDQVVGGLKINKSIPLIENKTHHEALLKALEIALFKLNEIDQKSVSLTDAEYVVTEALAEIEAVLKGCGDGL